MIAVPVVEVEDVVVVVVLADNPPVVVEPEVTIDEVEDGLVLEPVVMVKVEEDDVALPNKNRNKINK